jgi:hypothetical protein
MTDRPRSDAHAVQTRPLNAAQAVANLSDGPFIAYALAQAFKLFISLVSKRWPEIRDVQ